ncbi:MAG: MotA/TolQ/ExbB proton channel family protein [Fuerstiella sp.]
MSKRASSAAAMRTAIGATIGTVTFYAIAPKLPQVGDFVTRYFCSHPLEYISTVMFFTGMTILLQKFLHVRGERQVLANLREAVSSGLMEKSNDASREAVLRNWCEQLPRGLKSTQLYQRSADTLHYLRGSGHRGVEEHLRYLAELASERLHQTYATIRTITWAIPILGFLGTVIGITMAIANVTPEQLDSSLVEVTGGLAVAFDTTALALGMSIVLVFASFIVERSEQNVLNDVEEFGINSILPWFGSDASSKELRDSSPTEMASQLIGFQSGIWAEQLASVRETWTEVLQQHARQLAAGLDDEIQRSLKIHRMTTSEARDAYTEALQVSSQAVVQQTEQILARFEDRVASWQDAIQHSSLASAEQSEALHQLGAILLRMTESEERLANLQKLLNENLHSLQLANTMEQSANSLTAAVHILTARTTHRAA